MSMDTTTIGRNSDGSSPVCKKGEFSLNKPKQVEATIRVEVEESEPMI